MNNEQQPNATAPEQELDAEAVAGQTRRTFLKTLGGIAALAVAAPLAAKTSPFPSEDPAGGKWSLHKWGFAIDIEKCIGCGRCVVACKEENNVPKKPIYFRTWVERYREFDEDTIVDSPNGGYDGFPADEEGHLPDRAFFVPKLCNACEKSPCEQVCPVGATFRTPDGAVLVDPKYCIGCRYCIQACPYGCRFLNPITKTADKCTFCYHRIQKGLKPACVDNCPTGARMFGDLKNPKDPLSVFLKEHKTFVLKPQLNTYPKVRYFGIDAEVR
jgi:Fe-S-cluster-containing dehydrogenase component